MNNDKILYVDDEKENLTAFRLEFFRNFHIETVSDPNEALNKIDQICPAVVLVDQRMPGLSGVEFMERLQIQNADIIKIMVTGYNDHEIVKEAVNKIDLFRYINKPWDADRLRQDLLSALKQYALKKENDRLLADLKEKNKRLEANMRELKILQEKLEEENRMLIEELETNNEFGEIVTENTTFKKTIEALKRAAQTDATVLITGETGVGKELAARAVHTAGKRKNNPLIKVNCAAIPSELIESELFGHEKGAFTGALKRKIGKFELADGGTLFLDEIGELPIELQPKLLRALQEGEIERVGGQNTIAVDVRIVAATNRDLQKETAEGRFRSDLFYRLNVFPVYVPPLRERKEDIRPLTQLFVKHFAQKTGKNIVKIPDKVFSSFLKYPWPGNIRELQNFVERMVVYTDSKTLTALDPRADAQGDAAPLTESAFLSMEAMEKKHIEAALKLCDYKMSGPGGAAEALDLNYSTLRSRMKKLGVSSDKPPA